MLVSFFLLLLLSSSPPVLHASLGVRGADADSSKAMELLSHMDLTSWSTAGKRLKKGAPRIRRVALVGERHHGTNYMNQTLAKNIALPVSDNFCNFKHKYQAPHMGKCPSVGVENMLVVVMLRNPYDWAASMQDHCWCGTKDRSVATVKDMKAWEFMKMEFPETDPKPWLNERPGTKSSCGNLMQCRALKYANFINMTTWAPNVEFVRYEDVMRTEQGMAWVLDLINRYRLPRKKAKFTAVKTFKGWGGEVFDIDAKMASSAWFNPASLVGPGAEKAKSRVQLVTKLMDKQLEALVGYGFIEENPFHKAWIEAKQPHV